MVNKEVEEYECGGIDGEFKAFAEACSQGRGQQEKHAYINTPDEALKDLAFVEACLKSGQKKGEPTVCYYTRPERK